MPRTYRYHTRIAVRVDSHNTGASNGVHGQVIDLSRDVVSMSVSKSTKSMGKFQLQLVPRRNYLNLIFPDDVVNIYADPGDGERGFVRLLMGYVDRIERQDSVGDDGALTTHYVIIGSDFQKAIDKTFIYLNDFMHAELDERFVRTVSGTRRISQGNFGGQALRNAGITISGTPADFVQNFLHTLLGAQQQWNLPDTYSRLQSNLQNVRVRAVQRAKARMPTSVVALIVTLGFNPEELERNVDEILKIDDLNKSTQRLDPVDENSAEFAAIEKQRQAASAVKTNADLLAFQALVHAVQDPSLPIGIHDLLSFDFIEALAVDGFNIDQAVAQASNQTLSQFIYGHCNESVNELIFDLRPVGEKDGLTNGPYSKEPDELGINTHGFGDSPATVAAVQYVPAVVFREYPYSVVENLDLSGLLITPAGSASTAINAGVIPLGPVFAVNPNMPGRHTYTYSEALPADTSAYPGSAKPTKHIDCVVIHNTDVTHSSVGRSDEDVVNAFHLYATSPNAALSMRDQLGNFNPILNHISLSRHGLRLRETSTEFAYYLKDANNGLLRKNLVRWSILMDHWFLHNIEYLSGSITLRGMPEIRVGYRLDWYDRNESYYVESVNHQWSFPGVYTTTVEVSRGQRNDPFPMYVAPVFLNSKTEAFVAASGNRSRDGRLAQFFTVRDTGATVGAPSRTDPVNVGPNTVDGEPDLLRVEGVHVNAYVAGETTHTIIPFTDTEEENVQ